MTSANAVLMKFFKLPPAVRMMLALAGFGSLATIVFFLLPAMRTTRGKIWILVIGGIALVIGLLIYVIYRMIWGRRSSKLSGALESQGPTRGDIAEQEQIYREKFRAKLTELKTNGLSVYRLPWFVLMGEPGCGKTASLIHSGLDFPLGKDEVPGFGGTRNYNWWFTNDSVILDTAGRIAFHEEGTTDKVEWEYFLKLIQRHRPRCPVNGVIVAIPADRVLRDSAEERAQKATVLRERLRQVHQTLGVRFPTFVLVTKMDLVGGFSEFFEEIRVELQQRNQMLGWSRPGEFQEPYDPGEFPDTFDQVYFRLRDWSMRYLQRKATEEELGLVVTFPEAFRELRGPLHDYIGTIFQKSPLLEPPFFRGFYFSSAVQEGAPIFDVFAKARPGLAMPERPQRAVDSKAFFIHDLYQNKVFAEQGLVFRSAKHVTVNRRARRLVWIGSAAMLVAMLGLFIFGIFGVSDLITKPREDCDVAAEAVKAAHEKQVVPYAKLSKNLGLAQKLAAHVRAYNRPWAGLRARALCIVANISVPREHVKMIHARFVLDTIVAPILRETEARLASTGEFDSRDSRERYLAALETYTNWYGEVVGREGRQYLDQDEAERRAQQLEPLLEFLEADNQDQQEAVAQFALALESLSEGRRFFGREILRDAVGLEPKPATGVITQAVENLKKRRLRETMLRDDGDPDLLYWRDFARHVSALRSRYKETLDLAPSFRQPEQYQGAVDQLNELTRGIEYVEAVDTPPMAGLLAQAYYDLKSFLGGDVPQDQNQRILRFGDLLVRAEAQWNEDFDPLLAALQGVPPDKVPQNEVFAAIATAQSKLRESYERSLATLRGDLGVSEDGEPAEHFGQTVKLIKLVERPAGVAGDRFTDKQASIRLIDTPLGPVVDGSGLLSKYLKEMRELVGPGDPAVPDDLTKWKDRLDQNTAATPLNTKLAEWRRAVGQTSLNPNEDDVKRESGLADRPFWQPVELYELAEAVMSGHRQTAVAALLDAMEKRCNEVAAEQTLPGLGQLMPRFKKEVLPFRACLAPTEAPPAPELAPEPEPKEEDPRRRRRRAPPQPSGPRDDALRRSDALPPLVNYHTRDFLHNTLSAYYGVRAALEQQGDRAEPVVEALDNAADKYVDHYFLDWNGVYDNYCELLDGNTLDLLRKCQDGGLTWPTFQQAIKNHGADMPNDFGERFEALVREVAQFADVFEDSDRDDALYERVADRLTRIKKEPDLQDLNDRLSNFWPKRARRTIPKLAEDFAQPWQKYLDQVDRLGADPKGSPPDLAQLRESFKNLLGMRGALRKPGDFHLMAPLLDIAEYGEDLLRHHLQEQLAGRLEPYQARYPVVADADAVDRSADFHNLGSLKLLQPGELLALLRQAHTFEHSYGAEFNKLDPDQSNPYRAALANCRAWAQFLYGENWEAQLHDRDPAPLKVSVGISKQEGEDTMSVASIYNRLTITLPLLTETGYKRADPIELNPNSAAFGSAGLPTDPLKALSNNKYPRQWSLFEDSAHAYQRPKVEVSELNPTLLGKHKPRDETNWQLPPSPWSLLLLVGADPENKKKDDVWIIRVRLGPDDKMVLNIPIEFERAFPGPIQPLPELGPAPAMQAADKYLTAPSPRRRNP